jgi:signal transduction histidine kinase
MPEKPQALPSPTVIIVGAAAYFAALEAGAFFYLDHQNVSLLWPAFGLALAYYLSLPQTHWPRLAGLLAALFLPFAWHQDYGLATLPYAIANIGEPLLAAWLIRQAKPMTPLSGHAAALSRLGWFGLSVIIAVTLGAILGTLGFRLLNPDAHMLKVFQRWLIADGLGGLIFAPLLTIALAKVRFFSMPLLRKVETLLAISLMGVYVWHLFAAEPRAIPHWYEEPHWVIPLLIWTAVRGGFACTTLAAIVLAVAAIAGVQGGGWPTACAAMSPRDRVLYLQTWILVNATAGMALAYLYEKLGESELRNRHSERKFHRLFDSLPMGVGVHKVTDDGHLVSEDLNAASLRLFGVSRKEFMEMDPRQLFAPNQSSGKTTDEILRTAIASARIGKSLYFPEIRFKRFSTDAEWTASSWVSGFSSDETNYLITADLDISETQKQKETVRAQERHALIGRLAAGVAHEINNPLQIALSVSETLIAEDAGDKPLHKDLRAISAEIARAGTITKNLLRLGRKQPSQRTAFPVTQLLNDTLGIVRHELERAGIKIKVTEYPTELEIFADSEQVKQILLNLVLNARDALSEQKSPHITLGIEARKEDVCISVSDNGEGIPQARQGDIFEPFTTSKPAGAGSGLGLAVSLSLAHENGGSLFLATSGPENTRFDLIVPRP